MIVLEVDPEMQHQDNRDIDTDDALTTHGVRWIEGRLPSGKAAGILEFKIPFNRSLLFLRSRFGNIGYRCLRQQHNAGNGYCIFQAYA